MGEIKATLAPRHIVHESTLNEKQKIILDVYTQLREFEGKITSLEVLKEKAQNKKDDNKITGSLEILLNRFVPAWREWVDDPNNVSFEEFNNIAEFVMMQIQAYRVESAELNKKYAELIDEYKEASYEALKEKVNEIKSEITVKGAITPEDIKPILDKYSAESPAAVIWYKFDKASKDEISINLILKFFEPEGVKPPDYITVRKALFQQIYPEGLDPEIIDALKNWRQYLPDSLANLNEDEVTKKIPMMITTALHRKNEKLPLQKERYQKELIHIFDNVDQFVARSFESVLTSGLDSDDTVYLPVRAIRTTDKTSQHGMNVEDMLQKMNEISNLGGSFDLYENNCSSTSGAILAAGAEPELKPYFEERLAGVYGSPQVVLNGASRYHETILSHDGKVPFMEKLNRYNPLYTIPDYTGRLVHTYLDDRTGPLKTAALLFPIVGLGLVSGACEVIKAVANPAKSFEQCRRFINYAQKRNSNFLKACAVPVGILGAVLAGPAAIQTGITNGFNALISKVKNLSERGAKSKEPIDRSNIIVIDEKDPKKALEGYHNIAFKQSLYVPEFSPKCKKAVVNYLNSLDKTKPEDLKIIETYDNDTKLIFGRVKAQIHASEPEKTSSKPTSPENEETYLKARPKSVAHHHEVIKERTVKERTSPGLVPTVSITEQKPDPMRNQPDSRINYNVSRELLNQLSAPNTDENPEAIAAKAFLKETFIKAIISPKVGNPIKISQAYIDKGIDENFIMEAIRDLLNDPSVEFDPDRIKKRVIHLGSDKREIKLDSMVEQLYVKPKERAKI